MNRLFMPLVAAVLATACATELPLQPGAVVTMKASEAPPAAFPAPGTVWRLDEGDMKSLSPAPIAEPPPPPRWPPPPRPNEYPPPPPPAYYYAPPYGTYW